MELINKLNYDTCQIIEKIKDPIIYRSVIIPNLFFSNSNNYMLNNTAYIEFHKIYFRESDSISFDIIIRYYLKNKKFKRSCWYFTYNNHKHTFNKKKC